MSKWMRKYELKIHGKSGNLYTITEPWTCVFDINRRAYGSLNTGHFLVYNLSASVRGDIQYDMIDGPPPRSFSFAAGYESEGYMPVLYKGNLQRVLSYRDGADVVTEIQVLDGGWAVQETQVEMTDRAFKSNPAASVETLVSLMNPHGVTLGALGNVVGKMEATRGITWIGSVWDILKKMTAEKGGYACIDLEKVYLLDQNDVLVVPGAIPELNSSTGLMGTPRRTNYVVDANMLFEPRVQLMQSIRLASRINPNVNGDYSVQVISHRGTISGAKDGGVVTALSLMTLPSGFKMVTPR